MALAKAAIGENIGALEYLEKAVDNGWLHIDFLTSRKEFEKMHGTPAWNNILTKIQKKNEKTLKDKGLTKTLKAEKETTTLTSYAKLRPKR